MLPVLSLQDLLQDKNLLWIAKEGLKAPLPSDWKPCKSPDGELYYFNFSNGESVWDHPCDEHYRQKYREEKDKASAPVVTVVATAVPPAAGAPPKSDASVRRRASRLVVAEAVPVEQAEELRYAKELLAAQQHNVAATERRAEAAERRAEAAEEQLLAAKLERANGSCCSSRPASGR